LLQKKLWRKDIAWSQIITPKSSKLEFRNTLTSTMKDIESTLGHGAKERTLEGQYLDKMFTFIARTPKLFYDNVPKGAKI